MNFSKFFFAEGVPAALRPTTGTKENVKQAGAQHQQQHQHSRVGRASG